MAKTALEHATADDEPGEKRAMTVGDVLGTLANVVGTTRRLRVTFAKHAPGMGPSDETVTEEGDVYYFKDGTWILRGVSSRWYRSFRSWEVRGIENVWNPSRAER